MFSTPNLFKTLIISALVSVAFVFYESTTAFQQQVGIHGNPDIGRVEALLEASKTMGARYFWPHLLFAWFKQFALVFTGCALLLFVVKPPNKIKNENASKAGSDVA